VGLEGLGCLQSGQQVGTGRRLDCLPEHANISAYVIYIVYIPRMKGGTPIGHRKMSKNIAEKGGGM